MPLASIITYAFLWAIPASFVGMVAFTIVARVRTQVEVKRPQRSRRRF
jgi:hypothetical protein